MFGPRGILDTDLYKLTMQQAVCQLYPRAGARYAFINRGGTVFPDGFGRELTRHIEEMASLRLTGEEQDWLVSRCAYFNPVYLDFLKGYRFDPGEVVVEQEQGNLSITVEGYWYRSILWEVPLMALVSELYFEFTGEAAQAWPQERRREVTLGKARFFRDNGISFVDFGTRRRFSYDNQEQVVADLREAGEFLLGTSNVHLAHLFDLAPMGTHAHEWFQFHAAKYGFLMANSMAMGRWVDVFKGDLGMALTDTYGTDNFIHAFDLLYAKTFDGVRQDSGDPLEFMRKIIEHYRSLRIDPASKTLIFSDSLDPETVDRIHRECGGKIRDVYGIGTNLTNDVGVTPLNMVIKMVACRPYDYSDLWIPAVKLSDDVGKNTGDREMIELCHRTLGVNGEA